MDQKSNYHLILIIAFIFLSTSYGDDKLLNTRVSTGDILRSLSKTLAFETISGDDLVKLLNPLSQGEMSKLIYQLNGGDENDIRMMLSISGSDLLRMLERQTHGSFIKSLDIVPGIELLKSLFKLKSNFGYKFSLPWTVNSYKNKESPQVSNSFKRNFDEIDRTDFNGFVKKRFISQDNLH